MKWWWSDYLGTSQWKPNIHGNQQMNCNAKRNRYLPQKPGHRIQDQYHSNLSVFAHHYSTSKMNHNLWVIMSTTNNNHRSNNSDPNKEWSTKPSQNDSHLENRDHPRNWHEVSSLGKQYVKTKNEISTYQKAWNICNIQHHLSDANYWNLDHFFEKPGRMAKNKVHNI